MTGRILALLALVLAALPAGAGQPRDYAYLLLQGRLTGSAEGRPTSGATVRLLADGSVHETVTDLRGTFIFERLPVTEFELEIVLSDGTVLEGRSESASTDPARVRIVMRPRKGRHMPIRIEAAADTVAFEVPEKEADWGKFGGELAVFGAIALLLAL